MVKKAAVTVILLSIQMVQSALGISAQAADGYSRGVAAYNSHEYATAATLLQQAVAAQHAADPLAHYYLACSLMQTRHFRLALAELEAAKKLGATGSLAEFINGALDSCRRQCSHAGSTATSVAFKPSAPAAAARQQSVVPTVRSFGSADEVSSWTVDEQSNHYERAMANLAEAQRQLETVKGIERSNRSTANLPNSRQYGESEEALNARRADAEAILRPSRDAVRQAERELDEARELASMCSAARSRFDASINDLATRAMVYRAARQR